MQGLQSKVVFLLADLSSILGASQTGWASKGKAWL
jgi:hypothetical protein